MSKIWIIACLASGLTGALLALSDLSRTAMYVAGILITLLIGTIAHWIERKRHG